MPERHATPTLRRSAAAEPAARSRPQHTARAAPPVARTLALVPAPAGPDRGPTTRERLRASFGPHAPALTAAPAAGPSAELAAAPAVARPVTTRERVINAASEPVRETPVAEVVALDTLRERRRQRTEGPGVPPGRDGGSAAPRAVAPLARGPPDAQEPAPAQARAPPAPAAAEPETTATATESVPSAAEPPAPMTAAAETPVAVEIAPEGGEAAATESAAAAGAPAPAAEVEPEAPVVIRNPEDEPGFQAMKARTRRAARATTTHQPAAEGAATAQGAALAPPNDVSSQAAGAQVEVMGEQEPAAFDAQAFIAAVKRAVVAATPSTLEDVDEFKGSGAVGAATAEIGGLVAAGKESSGQAITMATTADPDPSVAVPKPVTDMVNDETGQPVAGVGAAAAMPGPRPPEQTDLSAGPAKVDAEMAAANVTDEQIARSNEPDFTGALDARQRARDHAATAPADLRAQEEAILAQGRGAAVGEAGASLQGMHASRAGALESVLAEKEGTKSRDETERARVATEIETIYTATKTDVEEILDGLDIKVDDEFTRGEQAARTGFEDEVDRRMSAYKADRYSGLGAGARWAWDKLTGMPDEVNDFYVEGRDNYLRAMDRVIEGLAATVGSDLTAARARIVEGRVELRAYVEALPQDLRAIGEEAAGKLEDRFDELSADVDAKQDALVDAVARRYVESRDAVDARIEELQAANKGLVEKALDAVVGVIKTIIALGEMLLSVLARAAEVVGDIIADPIGFLSNLVDGVMGGLKRFVARIATHLQNALVEWLFGTLGGAGITPPARLDGPGILDLVTQILGLTYAHIRARVARVVGEPVVAQMEQTVDVFKTLATAGVGALWHLISQRLGDLEDMVLGRIKEYVIERIVKGGIAWIIGLLNPVAAFIKACKAIYEIVMFIVDRAKQIMEFVNAILDSISEIAKGNLGAAEEKVESSLAKGLPLAIGFLASLLGLGDLSEKIRSIVAAVRRPIEKAIDAVVMGVARTFKRTFGGAAALARGKVEAGKTWAKAKVAAGKEWAGGKVAAMKERLSGRRSQVDEAADKDGAGQDDEYGPADEARHVAMLRELVPRLEEDESQILDDAAWFAARQRRAAALAEEAQPGLEPGVRLRIDLTQGKDPRQLLYEMDISPNTTKAAGAIVQPALTVGERYTFFVDKAGSEDPVAGRVTKVEQIGGRWVIWYDPGESRKTEFKMSRSGRPLGHGPTRTWRPAYRPDGTPNFRAAGLGGGENPVFRVLGSRSTPNGALADAVEAEPLALTSYSAPRETPPGLGRIRAALRSSGDWVPGHLVNGEMGGPGTNVNMVPIPRTTNAKMRGNYENALRADLQVGKYYYFHAAVGYRKMAGGGIGRAGDFVQTITVSYQEITRSGSAWARTGALKAPAGSPYTVPLPAPDELDPSRLGG